MAFWRKHRFLSLEPQDEQDKVMAGSEFTVRYIGSTYVKEDFGKTEKRMMEIFKNVVDKFQTRKPSMFRLIVDLGGAVVYDNEGSVSNRFQLCNIRYIIYSNIIQEYSKYFVLVGRGESDLSIRAHVFVCENKKKAKDLYETFIETFTLRAKMKKSKETSRRHSTHALEGKNADHDGLSNVHKSILPTQTGRRHTFDLSCRRPKDWNLVSEHHGCMNRRGLSEGNGNDFLEDGFTELARSRASSSDAPPLFSANQDDTSFKHFPILRDDVFQ